MDALEVLRVEAAFCIYFAVVFAIVAYDLRVFVLPFVGLFLFGFAYVAYQSFAHHLQSNGWGRKRSVAADADSELERLEAPQEELAV